VDRRALGRTGEAAAEAALLRDGWTLLERNARTPAGEIDLVLERRGVFGFVEVKARTAGTGRAPEDAVEPGQAERVVAAADAYLLRRGLAGAAREHLAAAVDLDARGRAVAVRILPLEP